MSTERQRKPRGRAPKPATAFYLAVLVTVLIGFAIVTMSRRQIDGRVAELRTRLSELRQRSRRSDEARQQASDDREVLMRVLQKCRRAEDIPDFGGPRIVSNQINGDAVGFYVPKAGNHQLRVNTSWEISAAEKATPGDGVSVRGGENAVQVEPPVTSQKSWTIKLQSGHGYLFATRNESSNETVIGWRLTSNAPDIQPREAELPLPPVRANMTSWTSYHVAEFPNRVSASVVSQLIYKSAESDLADPTPLRIGRWTKGGKLGDKSIKIHFDLEIISDNPPVALVPDVEALVIIGHGDMIGDYLGAGAYRLRLR